MLSFEHKLRVEYHHTDQMGIVHHSNYVKFFEAARTEWLRAAGLTYAEMERRGVMMPIVEVNIRYKQPAYYDELIAITVTVDELPQARMIFHPHNVSRGHPLDTKALCAERWPRV